MLDGSIIKAARMGFSNVNDLQASNFLHCIQAPLKRLSLIYSLLIGIQYLNRDPRLAANF